jgi:hypothetical protein
MTSADGDAASDVRQRNSGGSAYFPSSAPQALNQPILPGWVFGNVSITNANSASPETERRIVEAVSYGRQLGRVMDVLMVLMGEAERKRSLSEEDRKAFDALRELREEIEGIKAKTARDRLSRATIEQLASDLAALKDSDREEHRRLVAILRIAVER